MPLESLEDRCLLASGFLQTNLVADTPGLARVTDPNLINPWGLAFSPAGPFWIADGGTGVSTLYNAAGQSPVPGSSLVVQLPPAGVELSGTAGAPTGVVFNDGPSFQVAEGGKSAPSLFLFATEDGAIAGWNPRVDPYRAVLAVDNSASAAGAVYTGLALADTPAGTFLYAANFHTGTIDVFDQDFHPVHGAGAFADPSLPAGYAPFNIQDLGGRLYVTYALQDAARQEDAAGPGHGFLDVFDLQGHRLQRLASQGPLNSPWGLALAPEDFGAFRNDLLVGNFGDGHINAFDPATGAFLGRLQDA
ncbi:MAG: TIGR03118 family protein, partial [Planctomycetes bacterium]|nr:TIGR03118 family protein [Planctomycetota bacterium]